MTFRHHNQIQGHRVIAILRDQEQQLHRMLVVTLPLLKDSKRRTRVKKSTKAVRGNHRLERKGQQQEQGQEVI